MLSGFDFLITALFRQGPEVFQSNNGVIFVVTPLCGTRTFNSLVKTGYFTKLNAQCAQDALFTIIRPEESRLLTAYNKKILVSDDWKKVVLRAVMGLRYRLRFQEMVFVLISRKIEGRYIDKHFRPNKVYGLPVDIVDSRKLSELLGINEDILSSNRVRSSKDVAGQNAVKQLTKNEIDLVSRYLSLFEED